MQTIVSSLSSFPLGFFILHISHMPFEEESKQSSILAHPRWSHMRPFRCASSFIRVELLFWIHIQDPNSDVSVNAASYSSQTPHCERRLSQSYELMENWITKNSSEGGDAKLTWKSINALAVEHLSRFDLTGGTIFAGVGQTGVVTAFADGCAIQNVAPVLLKVVHHVVDIQEADTANQPGGDGGPFLHTKRKKELKIKKLILSTLHMYAQKRLQCTAV